LSFIHPNKQRDCDKKTQIKVSGVLRFTNVEKIHTGLRLHVKTIERRSDGNDSENIIAIIMQFSISCKVKHTLFNISAANCSREKKADAV